MTYVLLAGVALLQLGYTLNQTIIGAPTPSHPSQTPKSCLKCHTSESLTREQLSCLPAISRLLAGLALLALHNTPAQTMK
jgi:hypothetical protein